MAKQIDNAVGQVGHFPGCSCVPAAMTRRGALRLGMSVAAAGAVASLTGNPARAAHGEYEAMLLNCIDPRFVTSSSLYMDQQGLREKYSHFVIAGGPIGVVSPKFAAWHAAFWDNLAVSMQLHKINRIIGLTHIDCGAARIALGDAAVATEEGQIKSHAQVLLLFRQEVARRQPTLKVVTGIQALSGTVLLVNEKGQPISS